MSFLPERQCCLSLFGRGVTALGKDFPSDKLRRLLPFSQRSMVIEKGYLSDRWDDLGECYSSLTFPQQSFFRSSRKAEMGLLYLLFHADDSIFLSNRVYTYL